MAKMKRYNACWASIACAVVLLAGQNLHAQPDRRPPPGGEPEPVTDLTTASPTPNTTARASAEQSKFGESVKNAHNLFVELDALCVKQAVVAQRGKLFETALESVAAMCSRLCPVGNGRENSSLCTLKNPAASHAAWAADPASVRSLAQYVKDNAVLSPALHRKGKAQVDKQIAERDAAKKAADKLLGQTQSGAIGAVLAGDTASQFLNQALESLAKLIEERAKYEAVGWLLDSMGKKVCGEKSPTAAQYELRTYWFGNFCQLADSGRLWEYGRGNAMVEALRTTLQADMRTWAGSAVGLGLSVAFYAEARGSRSQNLFAFQADSQLATTLPIDRLRRAGSAFVSSLQSGVGVERSLGLLSDDFDLLNRYDKNGTGTFALHAPKMQIAACAMGLPDAVKRFHELVKGSSISDRDEITAASLASLVTVRACWTLVGMGHPSGSTDYATALQNPRVERLTTIARLHVHIGASAERFSASLSELERAAANYRQTSEDSREALQRLRKLGAEALDPKLPDLSSIESAEEAGEIAKSYAQGLRDSVRVEIYRQQLAALTTLSDASLGFVDEALHVLEATFDRALYPGYPAPGGLPGSSIDRQSVFRSARSVVERIRDGIRVGQEAAQGKWTAAATLAMRSFKGSSARAGSKSGSKSDAVGKFTRYAGVVSAIVHAKTAEDMAKALDQLASSPGGWRGKSQPGSFTVSLTSHAGLMSGVEWRSGEHSSPGDDVHWQPFALSMPVGVEMAWGTECLILGVFVSVIDPAAYLHYDEEGDLPGATIKTALAPGLGIRLGIPDTPFSFMPMAIYRPGFRAVESGIDSDGANVFQVSAMVSVDVTLYELLSSD